MPTKNNSNVESIQKNDSLPTLYVDGMIVSHREDGINYVRFMTSLPHGKFEQGRFIISDKDLKQMIEIMCKAVEHYPPKPKN